MAAATGTDLIIILDRSGSMGWLAGTVIEEVNRLVEAATTVDPSSTITVIAFDTENPSEMLVDRATAADLPVLTADNYRVGGGTPLYDAIGLGLRRVLRRQRRSGLRRDEIPTTLIAVITDGEENSSTRFNAVDILGMVQRRRARGWEFLYLGVGDVMRDGRRLGFHADEIQPWEANHEGTRAAFTEITDRTIAPRRARHNRAEVGFMVSGSDSRPSRSSKQHDASRVSSTPSSPKEGN